MMRALSWLVDYAHVARGWTQTYIHRNPPKHYLGYIVSGKNPVILLPGITNKWSFLKSIGDKISLLGHPVYIVPKLGYNLHDTATSAKIVDELIRENDLKNVVIVAHSKGGLIGKYLLIHHDGDRRIKNLIAIATPFSGSAMAHLVPHEAFDELEPDSELIADLDAHKSLNKKITSIIPVFDNHVWQEKGSFLEGARNIKVDVHGHHRLLFSKEVEKEVLASL